MLNTNVTQIAEPPVEPEVHPVLAEILSEEEPDTVSWVKG